MCALSKERVRRAQNTCLLGCGNCSGFGWRVPPIAWTLIGWVWAYNIAWMFMLGGVRLITERFAAYRTIRQIRSADTVNQSLRLHAAS